MPPVDAELHELITIDQANLLMATGAWLAAVVSAVALAVALAVPRLRKPAMLTAAIAAPWCLALSFGWDVYLWRVRFDPTTGFCGLHSVRVLCENALAAVVLGALYGFYLRWASWALARG
ncbi:MAG: hypothetical protein H5T86_01965 [Armatimonadetes bacterium]|nr:hypothetical protein [Armatimonadota bacterium]